MTVDPNGVLERVSKKVRFDSYEKVGLVEVTETGYAEDEGGEEFMTYTVLAWFDGETRVVVPSLNEDGANGCVAGLLSLFEGMGYGHSLNFVYRD